MGHVCGTQGADRRQLPCRGGHGCRYLSRVGTSSPWFDGAFGRISSTEASVAVLGCGYVGLTLAVELARAGSRSSASRPTRSEPRSSEPARTPSRTSTSRTASSASSADSGKPQLLDRRSMRRRDVYVDLRHHPAARRLARICATSRAAGESVAKVLHRGQLRRPRVDHVPGHDGGARRPILAKISLLTPVSDLRARALTRTHQPGRPSVGPAQHTEGRWRPDAREHRAGRRLLRQVCDTVDPVSSPRAAEITKLFENTYREVNIALANEMAVVCHDFDIDPWEVLEAAAYEAVRVHAVPSGPRRRRPCIPVDPQYLAWRVRGKVGRQFRLLETASDVNQRMPAHVAQRAAEILNDGGKALRGARVLLLGVSYKGGSGDVRESPALRVADRLGRARSRRRRSTTRYVPQAVDQRRHCDSQPLHRRAARVVRSRDRPHRSPGHRLRARPRHGAVRVRHPRRHRDARARARPAPPPHITITRR